MKYTDLIPQFYSPTPEFYHLLLSLPPKEVGKLLLQIYFDEVGIGQLTGLATISSFLSSFSCVSSPTSTPNVGLASGEKGPSPTPASCSGKLEKEKSISLLAITHWLQRSPRCSPMPTLLKLAKNPLPCNQETLKSEVMRMKTDVYTSLVQENESYDQLGKWVPFMAYIIRLVAGWYQQETQTLGNRVKFFASIITQYNGRGRICEWDRWISPLITLKYVSKKTELNWYLMGLWLSWIWTYPLDVYLKYLPGLSMESYLPFSSYHLSFIFPLPLSVETERGKGKGKETPPFPQQEMGEDQKTSFAYACFLHQQLEKLV